MGKVSSNFFLRFRIISPDLTCVQNSKLPCHAILALTLPISASIVKTGIVGEWRPSAGFAGARVERCFSKSATIVSAFGYCRSLLLSPQRTGLMTAMGKVCLVMVCICGAAMLLFSQGENGSAASHTIAIRAARLIDGRNNDGRNSDGRNNDGRSESVVTNAVIIVGGEKIVAVGSGLPIPQGATVLDLGDVTLLPGLIDTHTHLLLEMDGANLSLQDIAMLKAVATQSTAERALHGAKLAREDLEAGITTVRDLGNSGVNGDVALRNAIDNGWLPGPRIVACTRALAAVGGQFGTLIPEAQGIIEQEYVTINGPDSARQAVRQALYNGANCIKVIVNGSPADVTIDEMKAIVSEAHLVGVKVAAHAIGDKATRIAAEAGADSIEHAYVVPDDVLKMMAEKHIFLVPTDGTEQEYLDMTFGSRHPNPDEVQEQLAAFKPYVTGNGERLRRARKMGVPIAAGSDMYLTMPHMNRGQASLEMLTAYAEEGMTPMEIIHAATSNAAELLGWQDRIGTLEKGKLADIIAVPGDPLKDVGSLQHAKFVMKGGVVIKNELSK
jgi:imidazolonepropionase-like amidohydrolase